MEKNGCFSCIPAAVVFTLIAVFGVACQEESKSIQHDVSEKTQGGQESSQNQSNQQARPGDSPKEDERKEPDQKEDSPAQAIREFYRPKSPPDETLRGRFEARSTRWISGAYKLTNLWLQNLRIMDSIQSKEISDENKREELVEETKFILSIAYFGESKDPWKQAQERNFSDATQVKFPALVDSLRTEWIDKSYIPRANQYEQFFLSLFLMNYLRDQELKFNIDTNKIRGKTPLEEIMGRIENYLVARFGELIAKEIMKSHYKGNRSKVWKVYYHLDGGVAHRIDFSKSGPKLLAQIEGILEESNHSSYNYNSVGRLFFDYCLLTVLKE